MPAPMIASVAAALVLVALGATAVATAPATAAIAPATAGPAPATAVTAASATVATASSATVATAPSAVTVVPARSSTGGVVGDAVTVLTRSFPAGTRFVTATVSARHAPRSTRRPTMLSLTLTCGAESVQATTNILRPTTLTPRRLMADPSKCTLVAHSAVARPTAGDGVQVIARIAVGRVASGTVGYQPTGHPTVLRPGRSYDAVPFTHTVPARVRSVLITGDVKVTTCSSVGGSRENGSPNMCAAARLRKTGTRVRVSLVAQQSGVRGGYCAVRKVATRTVLVGPKTHHAMIPQRATYVLSRAAACGRTVRVKIYIQALSGADLLVHRRGTIAAVHTA